MDGITKTQNFSKIHGTIDARMAGIASSLFMDRPVTLADQGDRSSDCGGRTIRLARGDASGFELSGAGGTITYSDPIAESSIAALVAMLLVLWPALLGQMLALLVAAAIGWHWLRPDQGVAAPGKPGWGRGPLLLFPLLAVVALLPAGRMLGLWNDFFAAGSLVFGGGHVVLPLLQSWLDQSVAPDAFLTAYAAAQAVPGPMFSMASFLGANMLPVQPWLGALVATVAIFLPGFLLLLALQGRWQRWRQQPALAGAVAAVNAAVVGFLIAAWYQPVFLTAVSGPVTMAIVIAVFVALQARVLPVIALLTLSAGMGGFLTTMGYI